MNIYNNYTENTFNWSLIHFSLFGSRYCLGGVCPGTERGTIISPNHPANYPAKSSIKYILETNYGSKIKLYFGDNFKIEKGEFNSTSCEYDSVK